jgi:tetratricopeptide (TPR) repeat protein
VDLLAPAPGARAIRRRSRTLRLATLLLAGGAGCGIFHKDDGAGARAGAPAANEAPSGGATGAEPAGNHGTERTAVAAPGERRVPEQADPGASSPRRRASQQLVEEGKGYAVAGRDAEARERFESALAVDGSNGEAYFQLARLSADAGAWTDASGYYEQAEALLGGRGEWRAPLDELAGRIARRE